MNKKGNYHRKRINGKVRLIPKGQSEHNTVEHCKCEYSFNINDSIIGINECVKCGKPILWKEDTEQSK